MRLILRLWEARNNPGCMACWWMFVGASLMLLTIHYLNP